MNTERKTGVFIGTAFALVLPYLAFAVYFSLRLPQNHSPSWFTNTILIWFAANLLALTFLARRIFKRQGSEGSRDTQSQARAKPGMWIMRIVASNLVIVWSILFCHGVRGTMQGRYPLSRAIPAGTFLLFFIVVFAWTVYRSFQRKA
jgi:hypothetical protein